MTHASPDPRDAGPTPAVDPTRPTILQVLPALETGGAERGCVDVALATVQAGARALVASTGGTMVRELVRGGAHHLTLPVASKAPWVIRRNVTRLADLAQAYGVDLMHARSRAPAWSALGACRRLGLPFVTTVHAPYGAGNPLKRRYNAVMAAGDRVIAVSHYVADYVVSTYGTPPERIRVIPRGVDLDRFDPARVSPERVIQLATRWRLQDGQPVVLMPARLTRWKGQAVLLRALARLGRSDLRCILVGSDQGRGYYRQELERMIRRLGIDGIVHIDDHCQDMPAALKLSDVVVHASTDPEGFGRTIVEAQAMGRPVIASRLGAPPEMVDPGRTGWLVAPGDADALAGALAVALDLAPEARAALADAAMADVRRTYTRDVMTARTLDVYAELLEGRAADADPHGAADAAP